MAANINDKFSKVSTGVRPKTTAVAGVRAPSGTTLTCDDLTGWTTDTAVHFVTYKADAQGKVVAGSQTDFKGIVSGNSIINLIVTGGNDNGNAVGDIVQALPTAGFAKDLADGLLVSHNQDGTLTANSVNGQAIADGAVTPEKRSGGFKVGALLSPFSSTGTKSITGVGFKPKLIRMTILPSANSTIATSGQGAFDGVNQYYAATTGSRRSGTDACIVMLDSSGNIIMRAVGVSLDSDGFTVNVTVSNGVDVAYEAYA